MTTRRPGQSGGPAVVLLEQEPPATCGDCGKEAELRPYGPGGKRICFECAMSDPTETSRRYRNFLDGDKDN